MNYSKKNRRLGINSVIIIFTLFCLSCDKKEVYFFAQGNGPDLVFEVAPKDSAFCYLSFQSAPNKSNEVDKESVILNGNLAISWASKKEVKGFTLDLIVNENKVLLNDTFSLTISTLVNKKEQFFYYNDVLEKIPVLMDSINQSNKNVDSLFNIRATQQFSISKINVLKPLTIDLSADFGSINVNRKINYLIEEREYHNPADFPGVR